MVNGSQYRMVVNSMPRGGCSFSLTWSESQLKKQKLENKCMALFVLRQFWFLSFFAMQFQGICSTGCSLVPGCFWRGHLARYCLGLFLPSVPFGSPWGRGGFVFGGGLGAVLGGGVGWCAGAFKLLFLWFGDHPFGACVKFFGGRVRLRFGNSYKPCL